MNIHTARRVSRREWLRGTAAATLALGLWPGCARFNDAGQGGAFTFIAVNDLHYTSPRCPEWFERVTASIRSHSPRPEFCLVAGDLTEKGTRDELGPVRDVLRNLGMPYHAVIGNHDYGPQNERSEWDKTFPRSLNYVFQHRGWQIVGLDSSEGLKAQNTHIQPGTLRWVDENLRKLDSKRPTILFTHFPLGPDTPMRPVNADALLERFRDVNLVSVFNGHHHGFTERTVGKAIVTTNKCCAIARGNHDRTTEKGYFLCRAREGRVERQFIEVRMA
jgi:3',5'-cyclic AMP phosphodiesterase CpdA